MEASPITPIFFHWSEGFYRSAQGFLILYKPVQLHLYFAGGRYERSYCYG